MTKISWKPGTMLAPVPPALISCGTTDSPNIMTAAWTGIIASDPAMTYVSIRPSRYSHEIISKSGEFVINLTNLPLARAADWCGVKSGRNIPYCFPKKQKEKLKNNNYLTINILNII